MTGDNRISAAEARAMIGKKRGNKFGAKRTVVDGIAFDSQREAAYYAELKIREKAGEVCDVELQPPFPLEAGKVGEVIGVYKADFRFWDNEQNRRRVIDVKGVLTRETRRSIKHVRAQYGITVEIVK